MTTASPLTLQRLGFFTRLLDAADAAERYRLATAQIQHAEAEGFDSAWIAQHHFHEQEGGLPSPFVFLAQVAARTCRIRLGTGIVTLPLELPIRVAEDAAVLDLLCGGRQGRKIRIDHRVLDVGQQRIGRVRRPWLGAREQQAGAERPRLPRTFD